jgi:hypothetical protein
MYYFQSTIVKSRIGIKQKEMYFSIFEEIWQTNSNENLSIQ